MLTVGFSCARLSSRRALALQVAVSSRHWALPHCPSAPKPQAQDILIARFREEPEVGLRHRRPFLRTRHAYRSTLPESLNGLREGVTKVATHMFWLTALQ